jgi:DASS family divalent anion:Na+ symporter
MTVLVAVALWFIPPPPGVDPRALHLLAIFVATIVGIIFRPLPIGAVALIGITASVATGTLSISQALSGFGNRVIWLIVIAFLIARAFIKTGLSRRIAYRFVAALGGKTLGLGYGLVATDLFLAPAIPSNTARAGGVVYPILVSLSKAYGSEPGSTARRMGAYLTLTAFHGTLVTSAMFLTAMAANPLAAELAGDLGVDISWTTWALAASVPGIVCLAVIPLILYKLVPPEVTETAEAPALAHRELAAMGPMQRSELITLGTFIVLLVLWIFGRSLSLHSTAAALIGLTILLVTGVLEWDDVVREYEAWNTLVWFSALVMMAGFLNQLGFIPWLSGTVGGWMSGWSWIAGFVGLCLFYFYSHYLFASSTAHVSSMYAPFLAVSITIGTPPLLAALTLGFFSNLYAATTHYGTGPAPILFGGGYVDLRTWWKLGALLSIVYIAIWLGLGGLWWKILGYW